MIGFRNRNTIRRVNKILNGQFSIRSRTTAKLNEKWFIMVKVTPNDYLEVINLFWNSYFKREPTIIAAGLANLYNSAFENKLMVCLAQGLSLMLKCRHDGTVAGVAVNTTLCPWDPDLQENFAEKCLCPKTAQLMRFYAHVTREPNLWSKYYEKKIFEITYLTTRIEDNDRNMTYNLLKKSLDYGRDMTYNVIRVDATSTYIQTICEKLGMKLEYELPYNHYYSPDGKIFLHPPSPHKSVKVYIYLPHAKERTKYKK